MLSNKTELSFYGGVGAPTGSNFLLRVRGKQVLIDCGLFQGERVCEKENYKPFLFDPRSVEVLFVTHAHLDHIGRIPKLVREGFGGAIYSTPETKELARLSLSDSLSIMEEDVRALGEEPLFSEADMEKTFSLWRNVSYGEGVELGDGVVATLRDAGHILGSAMVEIRTPRGSCVFTGDLGNSPAPFLRNTEAITSATYLVMESVYGDRTHESAVERRAKLENIIESIMRVKGVLLIPAFSIERTQTLLYELNSLIERNHIAKVSVFLDSPLADRATEIYKRSQSVFNEHAKKSIAEGDDIFSFPGLRIVRTPEDRNILAEAPPPKIIIAGSGMSTGGRVLGHERKYLSLPTTTLLLVGFQTPGSLGRRLLDGAREISVEGVPLVVKAKIRTLFGYSAHKDADGLLEFVEQTRSSLKKVFVTMGELRSSLFLAQRIRDYLGIEAYVPELSETVELDL